MSLCVATAGPRLSPPAPAVHPGHLLHTSVPRLAHFCGPASGCPHPGRAPRVSPLLPSQVVRSSRGSLVPRAAGWSRLRCAAVSNLPLVLVFAVPALHPAPSPRPGPAPGQRRSRWAREGSLVGRGPEGGRVGCACTRLPVRPGAGVRTCWGQHGTPSTCLCANPRFPRSSGRGRGGCSCAGESESGLSQHTGGRLVEDGPAGPGFQEPPASCALAVSTCSPGAPGPPAHAPC